MTRRTFFLLAGIGYLALLYLHVRSSAGRSTAAAPARPSTGAMTYAQVQQAIRSGSVRAPTPPPESPAKTHQRELDSLERAKALSLRGPDLLLTALRRIWSAQDARQVVPEDAALLSRAADAVVLTEASESNASGELDNRKRDWRIFLQAPEARVAETEKALRRIGDAPALKTLHSMVDLPGRNVEAVRRARSKKLEGYTLAQWNALVATVSSAELESRLVAFIQTHPDTTLLPPSAQPLRDASWDGADWRSAAIDHVGSLHVREQREEEDRIDQLPMAELLKLDEHTIYWSVDRRVEKREDGVGLEGLTPLERAVTLASSLRAEVSNGGFDQFFFNSSGEYWKETLDGLHLVHADKAADIYTRALAVFPGGKPSEDRIKRFDQMDQIKKNRQSPWGKLDEEFWDCDGELETQVVAAVRASPDQIKPVQGDAQP